MEVIRLTESELHNIVNEVVSKILKEEGGMVGGAAANASGFMNGANNSQTSSNAQFEVPFGGVQSRDIYSPKGKEKKSNMTKVDMTPAMKRHDGKGGSISIPKERV